jgi:hypothetical protein
VRLYFPVLWFRSSVQIRFLILFLLPILVLPPAPVDFHFAAFPHEISSHAPFPAAGLLGSFTVFISATVYCNSSHIFYFALAAIPVSRSLFSSPMQDLAPVVLLARALVRSLQRFHFLRQHYSCLGFPVRVRPHSCFLLSAGPDRSVRWSSSLASGFGHRSGFAVDFHCYR